MNTKKIRLKNALASKSVVAGWSLPFVIIIRLIIYTAYPIFNYSGDSHVYLDLDLVQFFKLNFVTNAPPPAYGITISVLRKLTAFTGLDYRAVLSLFQIAVSTVALVLFIKILEYMEISPSIATFVFLMYGLQPSVFLWDLTIMTEGLSIHTAVIVFYFFIKLLKNGQFVDGVWMFFFTLYLVYLRPQYLTYICLLTAFLIVKIFIFKDENRNVYIRLLPVSGFCIALILIYCAIYNSKFGVFSITAALPRQNLIICMQEGFYDISPNQDFIDAITNSFIAHSGDLWSSMWPVLDQFGNKEISRLTSECFKLYGMKYYKFLFSTFVGHFENSFGGYIFPKESANTIQLIVNSLCAGIFQWLTIGHAMVISALSGIFAVVKWIKDKKPDWVISALFVISFTTVYPAFIATCSEYMRTMIGCLPAIYLTIAYFLQWLMRKDK